MCLREQVIAVAIPLGAGIGIGLGIQDEVKGWYKVGPCQFTMFPQSKYHSWQILAGDIPYLTTQQSMHL